MWNWIIMDMMFNQKLRNNKINKLFLQKYMALNLCLDRVLISGRGEATFPAYLQGLRCIILNFLPAIRNFCSIILSFYTVMLNLFQHLTSLEYRFHIGEILNQVQDDNKIGISNAGREGGCKSLHDNRGTYKTNFRVRYKEC